MNARRLPSSVVWEWIQARCGHHPFLDGRVARHRNLKHPCLLVGASSMAAAGKPRLSATTRWRARALACYLDARNWGRHNNGVPSSDNA